MTRKPYMTMDDDEWAWVKKSQWRWAIVGFVVGLIDGFLLR